MALVGSFARRCRFMISVLFEGGIEDEGVGERGTGRVVAVWLVYI
jgi:hypothetical protein